jgi:HSP20 family protein
MENMVRHFWDAFPDGDLVTDLTMEWAPRLDLAETPTAIEVKAELPGLEKKDIDISLESGHLIIKGEKHQEKEEKDKRFHRIERTYGSFYRLVRLPAEVQPDKIEAIYEDGVLKVTLPKTEEAKKGVTHIAVH